MPRHPRLPHSRTCTGSPARPSRPSRKVADNLFLLHIGPVHAGPFAEFDATMRHMWADQMKEVVKEAARSGVCTYWDDDEGLKRRAYDDDRNRGIRTPRGTFLAVAHVYGCQVWIAESVLWSEDAGERWALLDAVRACVIIAARPPCLIRFDAPQPE